MGEQNERDADRLLDSTEKNMRKTDNHLNSGGRNTQCSNQQWLQEVSSTSQQKYRQQTTEKQYVKHCVNVSNAVAVTTTITFIS